MRKSWIAACLINFLIASLMGVALRLSNVVALGFEYSKLIHAHSHAAMLGWVYLMLFGLFVHYFVPTEKRKKYDRLFWLTQVAVVGMMVSFPIQGYALFSILFSTMHIVLSYVFCFRIWKDHRTAFLPVKRLLNSALAFMILSTLGAWSLGIITNIAGKDSPLYFTAIQFFLHFQFNGWFVFGVLAIFCNVIFKREIQPNKMLFKVFYFSLLLSTIVTFALPLSWHFSSASFFYFNIAGVFVQLFAVICFLVMIQKALTSHSAKWLLMTALFSLVVKTVLQIVTIIPAFAQASHSIRTFTVGFIHLGMLGVITGFLFFFLNTGFIKTGGNFWKTGIIAFYIGFLATELILFCQGMLQFSKSAPLAKFAEMMLGASLLLPVGLSLILAGILKQKGRTYDLSHI